MNPPSHFEHLLHAAAERPEPQRLLFVFATAELPDDPTPAQRLRFETGEGGTPTKVICVDNGLDELTSFDTLVVQKAEADYRALITRIAHRVPAPIGLGAAL